MPRNKQHLLDGLVRHNVVLMSGIAIAPVAAGAVNFESSLALALGFSVIALVSVFICRFIPKKIVYTIRVIIYAVIAGLVYIPALMLLNMIFGEDVTTGLGVYLPVLAVNPLILAKTETRFCLRPAHLMLIELLGYIAGFDAVCVIVGISRDVLTNGRIGWATAELGFYIPALETVFGGLMFVGVSAGLFRALYDESKRKKAKRLEDERRKQEFIKEVT